MLAAACGALRAARNYARATREYHARLVAGMDCLELLRDHGPARGLDLVRKSDGRLSRDSVYVALQVLEEDGLVRARGPAADGRYTYEITSVGRARLLEMTTRAARRSPGSG
jgi:DNA-binding PadR family transcriptional regulator